MKRIDFENRKYVNKFGLVKTSSVDWRKESLRPLARCTFCVKRHGDAPMRDDLTLVAVSGIDYLACTWHGTVKL